MKYLNYQIEELKSNGGFHTAKEICSQPDLWDMTYNKVLAEKDQILNYLELFLESENPNVILTGAGTSAFIGESLVGAFQKELKVSCRAISTTDIITHPQNYFIKNRSTLLISFARSGDSPESVATVDLARKYCDDLWELNITCSKDGDLAKNIQDRNSYIFLLPEGANDHSLAMTSSFTSMLLAGLLILNIRNVEQMKEHVNNAIRFGNYLINEYLTELKKIAEEDYERMIFLGSGPLFGIAHESHLKVQEMSDGKIICKFDSFLGFRHGPKAVVNAKTVIVYLFSNIEFSKLYELDLVNAVNKTAAGNKSIAIGIGKHRNKYQFDLSIQFPDSIENIPEDFLSLFYILPAQIIGFYKSINLGLSPDSPSEGGAITRVVQGVKIYHSVDLGV